MGRIADLEAILAERDAELAEAQSSASGLAVELAGVRSDLERVTAELAEQPSKPARLLVQWAARHVEGRGRIISPQRVSSDPPDRLLGVVPHLRLTPEQFARAVAQGRQLDLTGW